MSKIIRILGFFVGVFLLAVCVNLMSAGSVSISSISMLIVSIGFIIYSFTGNVRGKK